MRSSEDITASLKSDFYEQNPDATPYDHETYIWWLEDKFVELFQAVEKVMENL